MSERAQYFIINRLPLVLRRAVFEPDAHFVGLHLDAVSERGL